MKPISFKQETGNMGFCAQKPHRVLLGFTLVLKFQAGSKPHLQGHRHLQADSLPAEPQNILKVLNIQYAEGKWGRDEEDSNH